MRKGRELKRFNFRRISTENRLRMICEEWDHAELEHPSCDPPPLPPVQKFFILEQDYAEICGSFVAEAMKDRGGGS